MREQKVTMVNTILHGDCRNILRSIATQSINMIYLDPPFFTQKKHKLADSSRKKIYSFDDKYRSLDEYLSLLKDALIECKRVLQDNGSLFLHCDKTASHHLRFILDEVFGENKFVNEIVWTYKRWSNSKVGLQNAHQTIFFYSKSKSFKFNMFFTDYSATTNIDQILQERERDLFGKAVYKKNTEGKIIRSTNKKGVPLSDVWDIPFLNPKAKERCGYPTQKPVELLKKIVEITTDANDIVLDPFCGSGTTCIAAKSLGRNYIGIDISEDAVNLSCKRLNEMVITESQLLKKGKSSYIEKNEIELNILKSIDAIPVQRNSAVDGFLKDSLIPIIIEKEYDSVGNILAKINKLYNKQKYSEIIIIQTESGNLLDKIDNTTPCKIRIIKTFQAQL